MIHALIVSLIAVLFAYLVRFRGFKYGLECAFCIITVFLAIRYDWGNDYMGYFYGFDEYNRSSIDLFDFDGLSSLRAKGELGWVFLNKLCAPIGFFGMVIVLTLFENYVLYRFIKNNVPAQWYWLAIFIFTFDPILMLTGASMMRQFLAMCIYILSIKYIFKHEIIKFVLLVLLASMFHTSALILLPTYFLGYIKVNTSFKSVFWIIPLYLIWLFVSPSLFEGSVLWFLDTEKFEVYNYYWDNDDVQKGGGIGLGNLFYSALLIVFLTQLKSVDKYGRLLIILYLLSVLFIPLTAIAPMVSRVGFYFSILSIACYPIVFKKWMLAPIFKYAFIGAYILLLVYTYINFFYSEVWYDKFFEYQTVFSAPSWA